MTDTLLRWGSHLANIPVIGVKGYLLCSAIVFIHIMILRIFKINILGTAFKAAKVVGKSVVVALCWPFIFLGGGGGDTHLAYK
jgi:hypothetical protein